MERDWDSYFIGIALTVSKRATCNRAKVGAVITKDNRILTTGYNGSPSGKPHCIDVGCKMENGHCIRTIHAETNAIAQAAKFGISLNGATIYIWSNINIPPCHKCSQLINAVGIERIVA